MRLLANERARTIAKMITAEKNVSTVSLTVKITCEREDTERSGRKILSVIGTVDISIGQCYRINLRQCYNSHTIAVGQDQLNVYRNQT
jgi:hypothetical protein